MLTYYILCQKSIMLQKWTQFWVTLIFAILDHLNFFIVSLVFFHPKALSKRRRKLTQVEDLGQLATSFGQGLRALALTCDDLRSLWSRSNLQASRRKFFTVWPLNPSLDQRKLSNVH